MRKKVAKVDFTSSMMPKNRAALLGDIYKNRFSLMLSMGLLTLLFAVPLIAVMCIVNFRTYEIDLQIAQNLITAENGSQQIFHTINVGNVVLIAACIIFALGLSGIVGIMRRLIFQEGVIFWADFGKSFKENSLCYAFVGLVLGLFNLLLQYCLRSTYFDDGVAMQIAVGCLIIVSFVACFISPMILTQATVYNLSLWNKIKNAFLLSMRMPHLSLMLLVINVAPYFLLLINNQYVYLVLLILLPLIIMPLQIMTNMLTCDYVLDKFINKDNYPQIYRKGMYNAENNDCKPD